MKTPELEEERILFTYDECRSYSEDLVFQIIDSHFPNIESRTKIRIHKNTSTSVRHFIMELSRIDEEVFYDYAVNRIIEEYEYLSKEFGYK